MELQQLAYSNWQENCFSRFELRTLNQILGSRLELPAKAAHVW